MRYFASLLAALCLVGLSAAAGYAAEIKTAFAVVQYADESMLKTFHKKVGRRSYGFGFGSSKAQDPVSTTRRQVNVLIGRVQEILDMRPADLSFRIRLLPSPAEVQAVYFKEYGQKVDYIAFYSPRSETVYFALNKLRRTVFAHEIAHAVIDRYFDKAPPVKIHELLAQYVEKQL